MWPELSGAERGEYEDSLHAPLSDFAFFTFFGAIPPREQVRQIRKSVT
jgi:hypothetical protein